MRVKRRLDAAETRDRLANDVDRRAELVRDRDRRRGVERVVAAGHREREIVDVGRTACRTLADQHRKSGKAAGKIDVQQAHVGLRILAVGEDAPILDAPDKLLHGRMIEAHDGEAVERQVLDEASERRP